MKVNLGTEHNNSRPLASTVHLLFLIRHQLSCFPSSYMPRINHTGANEMKHDKVKVKSTDIEHEQLKLFIHPLQMSKDVVRKHNQKANSSVIQTWGLYSSYTLSLCLENGHQANT